MLFAQAISKASSVMPELLGAIQGIIFLGCPHRGSKMTDLGRPVGALLQLLWARPNIDILSELEYDSPKLMEWHEEFRRASSGHSIRTINFFEQQSTQYFPFYRILVCAPSESPETVGDETDISADRIRSVRYIRGRQRKLATDG